MEEFADTFQQAQCAILHAQRDLIALRRLQDEPHAGDVTDASVGLQVSSQARQEEALLYLERGARILCGLLQGENAGGAPQEAGSMDAAKRAMRRYFEGQHEVQRRREEEFERLLTERGSELAAAQDAAVRFVQRASLRRLGMRMLGRWIQRTIIASADRRQVEVRRQFTKARDGIACRHAKMRSNRELRARCFYRWNAKRLEVALEARRNREMELEEELQRSQRDLQRAERELQRHMSREMSLQDRAHNAISCVEQELEEEVVRLKRAMDEMAYEFSERTSNYVRQQEELARHYTERERRLTLKVITAEDLKREEEQHSAHLASVVTAQEVSFASTMDTTFDTLEDCIMAKVNLLHAASLAVVHETTIRGTELTEQLTELMEQVELVAPLSEHVVQLQGRCDHVERRLEEMSLANKQQMSNLHQREMLMAGSLQRTQDVSRMRRIWNTWQLYMIRHRSARVQKKMHVELDEAHKSVWSRVEEWKERERRRAMDFLLEDEVYSRRCVIELENATRESLVNQTGRRTAETFMRAELASEERQCAELREDVGKLAGQVKYWKQMAVDLQLIQLQKGHEARLQRLAVMEHEERLSLCYEEFCEQQSIQQGIYALGVGASLQKQQQAMRVKLGTAEQELQGMGCLLVEYCAQNVFSRWMLFVRKRKEQKTKKHMATIANAAASWFSNSTAWVTRIHDMKLDLFFSHSHQVNGGFATTTRLFAAKVEAVKMEMKNTRSVCNRQVYTDISRYGTLWAEFTKTAANWCADRENLLLNFCQDVVSTTVAPIEKAMRLLSAERSLMAEHVQTVVKEMRLTTTETLAAQQERYDVVINELLQYQAFLENRIASAGVVEDIELQRKIREEHEAREARAREDMAAMARRIESLQEALRESDRHHEERRRHHEEEVAVLRYRLERQEENAQRSVAEVRSQHAQQVATLQRKIEELQNASAERHIALDGIVRQYQHILSTFEEELASRCDTFLTAATMLVEVERFSEELLRRSQLDLQHFSKVRQYENEIATLTGALQSARKQLEVKCCEMREEHEAREARAREDMAAMARRIESLQEALKESDRHHEERRRHHEEEVAVLRYRLERQEENAQRSVAEMRSQHAQQVATLQRKIEELQNASAERHIALDGIVRQYQHILSTFEEELASRCDTFLTAATMLVEVERFAEELLRRSQLDLQHFSKVRQYENEIATLTGALQSARKQLEVKCCEMREEHEAREARAREDMAAMARRIESLQEALKESDRHHEERRRHHEEEVAVLRYRLERQEENAQRSVAEVRSQHAQQVATLQRKIEELQNASAERHIAEQEEVPTSHEGKEQEHVCELELVVQCLKCELQEAEGRCTLMCEELQGLLTANCVMHRAVVAMTRRLLQATEPSSMTYFCQHLLDGVSHFAGTASLAASDLVDAKSRLFVACSLGPVSGERHRASFSPTVSRHSRRSVSTDDVMRSMLRYSEMLNEQRYKNDARVRRLDVLVTQFDDLIERGRAVTRLEGGTLTT